MTLTPPRTVHYEIAVPVNRVEHLTQALEDLELHLDPVGDMIGISEDDSGTRSRGTHTGYLVDGINQHLRERDLTPLVPQNHENWNISQRGEFLELAAVKFNWDEFLVAGTWWETENQEENRKTWTRTTQEYPNLFG